MSFRARLAKTVEPGHSFFPAEDYHQDFLTRHPDHGCIVINDLPKVAALQRLFPGHYRAEPVLVSAPVK
jgi:peptide-methionine (S)-S-oxide reductase